MNDENSKDIPISIDDLFFANRKKEKKPREITLTETAFEHVCKASLSILGKHYGGIIFEDEDGNRRNIPFQEVVALAGIYSAVISSILFGSDRK